MIERDDTPLSSSYRRSFSSWNKYIILRRYVIPNSIANIILILINFVVVEPLWYIIKDMIQNRQRNEQHKYYRTPNRMEFASIYSDKRKHMNTYY